MTNQNSNHERLQKELEIISQNPAMKDVLELVDECTVVKGISKDRAIGMKTVGIADLLDTNPAKAALLDRFLNPSRRNIPDIDHPNVVIDVSRANCFELVPTSKTVNNTAPLADNRKPRKKERFYAGLSKKRNRF